MKKKNINLKAIKNPELLGGVSGKFFLRHLTFIIIGVFLALSYISVRFDCVTGMETVAHLKKRLEVVRTETQRERAAYMSATCESSMKEMVDTLRLGLHIQDQPPYRIRMSR